MPMEEKDSLKHFEHIKDAQNTLFLHNKNVEQYPISV